MRHTTYNITSYMHPCAMSLTFNVGFSHIDMHAHNMVRCCMNASMEVFYYEVQIGKLIHGMTKNPNKKKNMIDKVFFLTLFISSCAYSSTHGSIFFPCHFLFFYLMLNIQKNIKSPGGKTMNYTEKTAVHLSSIQCCIMCANDTRIGPLLKKFWHFITYETSE